MTVEDKSGETVTVEDKSGQTMTVEDKSGQTVTVEDKSGQTVTVEDKSGQTVTVEDKSHSTNLGSFLATFFFGGSLHVRIGLSVFHAINSIILSESSVKLSSGVRFFHDFVYVSDYCSL